MGLALRGCFMVPTTPPGRRSHNVMHHSPRKLLLMQSHGFPCSEALWRRSAGRPFYAERWGWHLAHASSVRPSAMCRVPAAVTSGPYSVPSALSHLQPTFARFISTSVTPCASTIAPRHDFTARGGNVHQATAREAKRVWLVSPHCPLTLVIHKDHRLHNSMFLRISSHPLMLVNNSGCFGVVDLSGQFCAALCSVNVRSSRDLCGHLVQPSIAWAGEKQALSTADLLQRCPVVV